MRKILTEAKADLESGIAKSLVNSPLTLEEVSELESLDDSTLIKEHGLDIAMAMVLKSHVESEKRRIENQHLMTRDQLKESIRTKLNSLK